MSSPRQWSEFQSAIFEAVRDTAPDAPHLAARARAGSGKTTTGVECLRIAAAQGAATIGLAFNASIAKELGARLAGSGAMAKTFHGAGFGAVRNAFRGLEVDPEKSFKLASEAVPSAPASYCAAAKRVVSLARSTLTRIDDLAGINLLVDRYGVDAAPEADQPEREDFVKLCAKVLATHAKPVGTIDYDDMCWLPIHLGLHVRPWDFVLADEAQDLNACQHALVDRLVGRRGRLLAIGDDRQAIYGFRGADENSFDLMVERFDATVFPLPVCYRCDEKIVALAAVEVPDLRSRPAAPPGLVKTVREAEIGPGCRPGDFVISRTKAPLASLCLQLIADGVPAQIVGRDIAGALVTLIGKSKAGSTTELRAWFTKRAEKASEGPEDIYEERCDQHDVIDALCRGAENVSDVRERLHGMFGEGSPGCVRLSTVHKAKGLEANRVWLLGDTFNARNIQERNLFYVAVTRAQHELYVARKEQG